MEVISPGEDGPNPRPSELPDHTLSYEIPNFPTSLEVMKSPISYVPPWSFTCHKHHQA